MGKRYRTLVEGPALFFITASTIERRDYFINEDRLGLVLHELLRTVKLKACYLMGYVIMPNHVHFLIGLKMEEKD